MMNIFNNYLQKANAVQQDIYEISADWNVFPRNEVKFIKNYVGTACFLQPKYITVDFEYIYEEKKHTDLIEKITSKILSHTVGDEIYCITLYNVIFETEQQIQKKTKIISENEDDERDNYEMKRVPIFKIKRETDKDNEEWFIDIDCRVYKTWTDYLQNNKLPPCTMVVPKDGKYQADPNQSYTEYETHILTEHHQYPLNSDKILQALDVGTAVLSLGITSTIFFTPVGPLMLGIGIGSGIFSSARSIQNLIDRRNHEESLRNKEALSEYLSIGSTILGMATMGTASYISKIVSKGEQVRKTVTATHDIMTLSTICVNGAEIGCKIYSLVYDDNKTKKDYIFLATDIFFFSLAVINMRMSKNLIEKKQTQIIDEYKKTLKTKRHRKSFNKIMKKSSSNEEVIRKIVHIIDQKQFKNPSTSQVKTTNKYLIKNIFKISDETSRNCKKVFEEIKVLLPNDYITITRVLINFARVLHARIQNSEIQTYGDLLSELIQFLWNQVKIKVKTSINHLLNLQSDNEISQYLFGAIETKLDDIIERFKCYVIKKYNVELIL